MMDLKVEWTLEHFLSDTSNETKSAIPVVRLAEVEKLIAEAVNWARAYAGYISPTHDEAEAFLASVAAWRKGQKEGKT